MRILVGCTPATGHINPMLGVARILLDAGQTVTVLTGSAFRDRVEGSGARFRALPGGADMDTREMAPELAAIEPGPEWFRVALERIFVDRLADQHRGLLAALEDEPADVVVADDMFFGALPMLLGPRSRRPPIALCGTSFLHWERDDGAPHFLGLPPARTADEAARYADIAREHDALVHRPVGRTLNGVLASLGADPMSKTLFDSVVELADRYLQLSVPGFEFPRAVPASVRFIGCLPIVPDQAPLPPWAADLDGARKVVAVTQGTVANHDFGLLVGPTLAALADMPDVLVVATAGGRPVDAIPGPLPANARTAAYLPFEWLLPRADVLVTNGGYGSVNQALSHGVPIVAAGLTEDKADVNARIAWSGAGIDLGTNTPTPDAIRAAVQTVLGGSGHRAHARRLAAEFGDHDTRAEVLGILRELQRGGPLRKRAEAA